MQDKALRVSGNLVEESAIGANGEAQRVWGSDVRFAGRALKRGYVDIALDKPIEKERPKNVKCKERYWK